MRNIKFTNYNILLIWNSDFELPLFYRVYILGKQRKMTSHCCM